MICAAGMSMLDIPTANVVWGTVLRQNGFVRRSLPDMCPECYTVAEFTAEHTKGEFAACTGSHVVAVVDGNYYDTWDSGDETVTYFYEKIEENGKLQL